MMQPEEDGCVVAAGIGDPNSGGRAKVRNVRRNVANDFTEEEFQFCLDQLFNGDYEQSRTALECLAEECDELGLYHIEGFAEVVNKKARHELDHQQQQQQMPSTSQAGPSQARPKRKCSQKQLDYFRKYRAELKKNPAKYQEAVRKMRAAKKQQWEQMSNEEREAYRKRDCEQSRKYYHNLSGQKRREKSHTNYERVKVDETRMEKMLAQARKYKANWTEEQKDKQRQSDRESKRRMRQNMTEQEEKAFKLKRAEISRRHYAKKKNNATGPTVE